MTIAATYKQDDLIPVAAWGRDHWSTLGYIASIIEDFSYFQVGFDARMRQNRRNFRVMAQQCEKPKRVSNTPVSTGMAMQDAKYASLLRDGSKLEWAHDDWCCVQDMIAAGLLFNAANGGVEAEPGSMLKLTKQGIEMAQALRLHKMNGGSFGNFNADKVILAGAVA